MAKPREKERAKAMRLRGESIREITRALRVSKSSVSLWCAEVELSTKQREALHRRKILGGHLGRMRGAQIQKERRARRIEDFRQAGINETHDATGRDIFFLGLGLYIGEGGKTGNRFRFTNADPNVIRLIMLWLYTAFNVSQKDISCRIYINETHRDRVATVERAWSEILCIPKNQFSRTVFIHARHKKIYPNRESYLGTLALSVRRSSVLFYRVLGLIHGLVYNLSKHWAG